MDVIVIVILPGCQCRKLLWHSLFKGTGKTHKVVCSPVGALEDHAKKQFCLLPNGKYSVVFLWGSFSKSDA